MRFPTFGGHGRSRLALLALCVVSTAGLTACAGRPGPETLDTVAVGDFQPTRVETLYSVTTRDRGFTPGSRRTLAWLDSSAAGRQATHPLLCSVEASHGRGPLWRLCGLLADLQAALACLAEASPQLLISDYRLAASDDGLRAIERLQNTMSGAAVAYESGFHRH